MLVSIYIYTRIIVQYKLIKSDELIMINPLTTLKTTQHDSNINKSVHANAVR